MTIKTTTNSEIMAELKALRAEILESGGKTDAMYEALMVQPEGGQPTLLAELQELARFARHGRWSLGTLFRLLLAASAIAMALTAITTFIRAYTGGPPAP